MYRWWTGLACSVTPVNDPPAHPASSSVPPRASATPLTLEPVAFSCHLRISTRSPRFLGLLGWLPGGTIGKRAGQDLSECIGARDGPQVETGPCEQALELRVCPPEGPRKPRRT